MAACWKDLLKCLKGANGAVLKCYNPPQFRTFPGEDLRASGGIGRRARFRV